MPRKEVRTYVDQDLLNEWRSRVGDYATVSWLLETSMRETLELIKAQPTLAESVKASIHKYILNNNSSIKRPENEPTPNA